MEPRKKTVAIIGSGPSGLTTAKSMLEVNLLPTVFEKNSQVGGLWAPSSSSPESSSQSQSASASLSPRIHVNPSMRVNGSLSCNTFSDWYPFKEDEIPSHVTADVVLDYLQGYAETYLPDGTIKLNRNVTNIAATPGHGDSWRVESEELVTLEVDSDDCRERKKFTEVFDFLVIATGAFNQPYVPFLKQLKKFPGTALHTSQYVGEKLFPEGLAEEASRPKRILVVGGYLSATEIAAEVALRASSLLEDSRGEEVEVLHLFPKPFWVVPRLLPILNLEDGATPSVLPLDYTFYSAQAVVDSASSDPMTLEEKNIKANNGVEAVMGSNQEHLGAEYTMTKEWKRQPPGIGISESYDKFVRTGAIKPILGRYNGIAESGGVRISLVTQKAEVEQEERILKGIDTIIFGTGYTPWPALLHLFSPDLLETMGIKEGMEDADLRFLYERLYKDVLYPELGRNVGFIGMHKRPFWGVLEIQARWLASLFSGMGEWPDEKELLEDRGTVGGYLDTVADVSRMLGIEPLRKAVEVEYAPKTFIPAHFPSFGEDPDVGKEQREKAMRNLRFAVEKKSVETEYVSKAIFAELQGRWRIKRRFRSSDENGEIEGIAEFYPRLRTFRAVQRNGEEGWVAEPVKKPYLSLGYDVPEYLYSETANASSDERSSSPKSIYQYDEKRNRITMWSVNNRESVGRYSHDIDFTKESLNGETWGDGVDGGWKARGESALDGIQHYYGYRFVFRGARIERFLVRLGTVGGGGEDRREEMVYVRN